MDQRQLRAISIANNSQIIQNAGKWIVPSQSGPGHYSVGLNGTARCSCPDFDSRGVKCKHIWAVEFTLEKKQNENGSEVTRSVRITEKVERTYAQNWPAYNAAQTNEKDHFQILLKDLCADVPEPTRAKKGRRPLPISDLIFSAVFKVYSTASGRRFMSDLKAAHGKGFISKLPCYNSIFNALESETTTPILIDLITQSSLPLKAWETSFACDSSGFSASRFDRWFDHKHGKHRIQRAWVKAHIMCGVRTNVVTAVEIHGPNANDSPLLPPLLNHTANNFNISEVSADLGYSSEENLKAIAALGASPFIPFKSNATPAKGGLWAQMFYAYHYHRERFSERYHLRSNVESTFSMIKAKFGDSVRSKTDTAMKNEVLAKILCHNICCIIQTQHEVSPLFLGRTASCPKMVSHGRVNGQGLAGDIFNFFPLDESTVGFYLLDVSGHGIPSAMLSFTLSNLLSPDPMKGSPLKRYDPDLHEYKIIPPAEAAADLNQRFCGQNGDMYFTMVYGTLNTRSRQLRLAQAGHPHPLYLGERSRSVLLGSGGFPVGMLPGIGYDVVEKTLAPGERLFLYSDGVIECENPERQSFTAERLSRILEESRHLPLRESMQRLQEQLEQWRGSDEYEDDVSVLALEI